MKQIPSIEIRPSSQKKNILASITAKNKSRQFKVNRCTKSSVLVQKQLRKKLRQQQEEKANLEKERRGNEFGLAAKSKSFENSEIKVRKKGATNTQKLLKIAETQTP